MAAASAGTEAVKQLLSRPIQLADQLSKLADEARTWRPEGAELKPRADRLAALLRQAARAAALYDRPTRRVASEAEQALLRAIQLVTLSSGVLSKLSSLVMSMVDATAAVRRAGILLDASAADVSWLLRVSNINDEEGDEGHLGLPPIAANEPNLYLVWEQVAGLFSPSERVEAAAAVASLARDGQRYGQLIIEEGGVPPLLRLLSESESPAGQENAALAIGRLGSDSVNAEALVQAGACSALTKVLGNGSSSMRAQAMAAWAVGELAESGRRCQDAFDQCGVVRLLVAHLAFETLEEHSKYSVFSHSHGATKLHAVVKTTLAAAAASADGSGPYSSSTSFPQKQSSSTSFHFPVKPSSHQHQQQSHHYHYNHSSNGGTLANSKARALETPETKTHMKAMAARALAQLAKGNVNLCRAITDFRALLCLAGLLEKRGDRSFDEVRLCCATAILELTRAAETHPDLRRSGFKPTSTATRAVVDQLVRIVANPTSDHPSLLLPSVQSLGCLAKTFRASETRIVPPLVRLLDESSSPEVQAAAAEALGKFTRQDNFLHEQHSRAVVTAGGGQHLVQLVYFGEPIVRVPATALLCFVAVAAPDCEQLAESGAAGALEWAAKQGPQLPLGDDVMKMLPEAKSRLDMYRSEKGAYPAGSDVAAAEGGSYYY